jgi:cell division protein FtsI/penicillin-binding protein 2
VRRQARPPQHFERRLFFGTGIGGIVIALVAARLVQVQIVEAKSLRQEAHTQQYRTLELKCVRGSIVDRRGEVLAVTLPADRRGTREAERLYPQGRTAAQIIGTTSADGRGLEGLELAADGLLRGTSGSREVAANAHGFRYTAPEGRVRPPEDGATLLLTLDSRMQAILERELKACVERTGASAATGVFMNPSNGDVLAMGSYPTYDPQEPGRASAEARRNRAITDVFEPGSTFKMITAAACLEEGLADPGTTVLSAAEMELAGGDILHDKEDHGEVTLEETLVLSVNTATAMFARLVGPERMYDYARAFGFGCVTGIELPGEVSGILRRPVHWSGRSLETISIGQEVAVTPLQLVSAYAAIANHGELLAPRVVQEVRSATGKVLRRNPVRKVRRVVSEETAETLLEMLTEVVESGTGRAARVPGIRVAGKTGTAQRIDPETGRYDPRRHVAFFVGMVPPGLAGMILVDRPATGVGWGGEYAAPCFRRVVEGFVLASREPVHLDEPVLGTH